jgi:hypothetical protein
MYERKKSRSAKKSAKNLGARKIKERESANAKVRNLRPKKERESASAKSSAKECESASAKRKKKRVPSSAGMETRSISQDLCIILLHFRKDYVASSCIILELFRFIATSFGTLSIRIKMSLKH